MRNAPLLTALLFFAACGGTTKKSTTIQDWEDTRVQNSRDLLDALNSKDASVRERAAVAMGRIQSPSYAGDLARHAWEDGSKSVRLACIFALGQYGLASGTEIPQRAREICSDLIKDVDEDIIRANVEALGKLHDKDAPELIMQYLKHPDASIRAEAAFALYRWRWVPHMWRRDVKEPTALPEDATDLLTTLLKDESPTARWAAAYAFCRYGEPKAVKTLLTLIDDTNEWARYFAVIAVGKSKDESAVEDLLYALTDDSERVRGAAVQAIGRLNGVDKLPGSLKSNSSFHVRAAYARALAGSKEEDTLETLRELSRDDSTTVVIAAIGSLATRLKKEYLRELSDHLEDARWPVRSAAAGALSNIGQDAMDLFETACKDKDPRVVAAALGGMKELKGVEDFLVDALIAKDLAVRGTAVSTIGERKDERKLEWLSKAYDDSPGVVWIEIRESIADTVAEMKEAVPLLRRMATRDKSASVRMKAAAALRKHHKIEIQAAEPPIELSPFAGTRFEADPVVVLETSKGNIVIRCTSKEAPIHVANFVDLVKKGTYNGTVWHRVVSNFVIQGGDPLGNGWGGPGYNVRDEINRVRYKRGVLGMPKGGKDTGGCQIFITHTPTPHLDGNYTVYGVVIEGLDVVDRIEVGDTIKRAYIR